MKIVIDIPIEQYNEIVYNDIDKLRKIIKNGIPLDDIKAEIDTYLQNEGFGSEYRNDIKQIIDNHIGKEHE